MSKPSSGNTNCFHGINLQVSRNKKNGETTSRRQSVPSVLRSAGILAVFLAFSFLLAVSYAIPSGSPAAPTDLAVTAGDGGGAELAWTTPADNGSAIIRYEYRVREDGETVWDPDWTEVPDSDASTTSYTVDNLTNGTVYTFEVRAVNSNGGGAWAEVSAVPGSIAPLPIAGCTNGTFVSDPGSNAGLVSDCGALVAIRNHWTSHSGNADFPGTHPLRTWGVGESTAISEWAGVSVSNQRVTGLNLRAINNASKISGTLPTQLGDLSSLSVLHLSNNRLTGSIPEELGDLSSLTQLYLYNNKLRGSIPEELGDLSSLTQLSLHNNKLRGSIPEELGDLSSLKHLYLYNNKLRGSIPEELGDLSSLKRLYLSGNELTGSIPEELGDLSSLERLYLYNNKLRGSIPEELGDLSGLTHLYLYNNELTGLIPEELGDLSNLTFLYLYNNELTGSIPGELGDLSSLIFLYLFNNELTGSIPEELGDLTSLERLYLSGNELTGSIPEELGDLSSLERLYISNNELTGSIPEELGDLSSLIFLYLYNNELTGSIPEELGDLTSLERLYLSGNELTGSIPEELGDLSSLIFLYLYNNELTGSIPEELGDLSSLTYLHLGGNELTGSIPEELGDLSSLTYLHLRSNQLTGSVPEELGSGSLAHLYICRNLLSLTLPVDLQRVAGDVSTCAPAPTGLAATAGDGQVTLSWSDSGNAGIRGYEYRVCEPGGMNCGEWTNILGSGASTASYVAGGLENDREHLFQLRAVNGSGPGMSAEVVGRPDSSTAVQNEAPTADAGDDQEVSEGATVRLDGSGSSDPEGETLTYAWTKTSGPEVTLSSATVQSPTFTAPTQLSSKAVLVFSLVVTDARGLASSADTVTVTVRAGANDAPTADAGDDQEVSEGATVTLDGSGSSDPEGETFTYAWTKTSGPEVTLSSAAAQSPTFTAPTQLASNAVLVFSLVVTDARGLPSSADRVTVTVTAGANDAPAADAGDDQEVSEGATVRLDGSGSSDPEGETLTYAWTKTSGPEVTLSSAAVESPTFTAPTQLASNAVLVFSLVVTDARGRASSADTVTVKVRAGTNDAPAADAGDNQEVSEGATVTLDGSGSSDPEGETLTYAWTLLKTSGPEVTLSSAAVESPTFTAPTQLASKAVLKFSLVVTDARGRASSADRVTVTVRAGTNDAPTADAGNDQKVSEGATVRLDGSGSSDPEGETLSYAWTKTSGPEVTLSSATVQSPTFTAPTQLASKAVVKFSLVVTDARGLASSADRVTVKVRAGTNDAPTADAGDDQEVSEGATVRLDGSGSSDPEGETLTYAWTKTSGPEVTLSSATVQSPTFTAPTQLSGDVVFVFSLVVTDARGLASSADTVTVTVTKAPELVLSKTSMSVRDNGSSDSLSVRLDTQPTGTVTVAVGFVDAAENDATLSTSSLTFTTSTWDTNQTITVTGRDDGGESLNQTADFTLDPSGANYNNVATVTVSVTVTDAPGQLVLSKTSMSVRDNGSSDSLTVRLSKQPTGTVTVAVGFVSSGEDDATLSTSSLTFTTSTWNTDQTITVTGRDDGGSSSQTAHFTLTPSGANYDNVATVTVSVTVTRAPRLVLSKTSMSVRDNGSSDSLSVRLDTQPTGTVTVAVGFVSSGEDDATLSTSSLTFTTSTWNTDQTITVTGRDDGGSSSQTANFTLNPSGANYNSAATLTVSVAVTRAPRLATPGNVTITYLSGTGGIVPSATYRLSWNTVPNAQSYEISYFSNLFGEQRVFSTETSLDYTLLVGFTISDQRVRATASGYEPSEWAYP